MDTFSVDDNMDGGQDRSAEPQGTPEMGNERWAKRRGTTRDNKGHREKEKEKEEPEPNQKP